jgi:hypothetical protein
VQENNIEEQVAVLVKSDEIPNHPLILEKIKSGELSVEKAKSVYSTQKQRKQPKEALAPIPPVSQAPKPVFGAPTANSVIKAALSNDSIPDDPRIIDAIKKGKLSIKRAQDVYSQQKNKNPIAVVRLSPETTGAKGKLGSWGPGKHTLSSGNSFEITKEGGINFKDLTDNERKLVLNNIREWDQEKKSVFNTHVNDVKDLKTMPVDWSGTITKVKMNQALGSGGTASSPAFQRESVVDFTGLTPGVYGAESGNQFAVTTQGTVLPGNLSKDELAELNEAFASRNELYASQQDMHFMHQKMLSGFTFGVYNPNIDPIDESQAITGLVAELAGGLPTGIASTQAFAQIPKVAQTIKSAQGLKTSIQTMKRAKQAAKALGNVDEAKAATNALLKLRSAKAAKEAVVIGGEGFTIGGTVGATKSLFRGDEKAAKKGAYEFKGIYETIKDATVEGVLYGGLGILAMPVAGVIGKAFGMRKAFKSQKAVNDLVENQGVKDLLTTANYDDLMKTADNLAKLGPDVINSEQQAALAGFAKMKGTQPVVGTEAALLANPEVLTYSLDQRAKMVADSYLGEGGLFTELLGDNPQIKMLYDQGKNLEVLDNIQASVTDAISKDPDLMTYISAPFMKDSKSLSPIIANRVINNIKNPERFPELKKFIVNYVDKPDAENALLLSNAGPRGIVDKINKNAHLDARMKPQEIDNLVEGFFSDNFKVVSNQGKPGIDPQSFGGLKDADEVLRSSITANKELSRSFITGYIENPNSFDSNFKNVKPEIADPVHDVINLRRINVERSTTLKKRRELSQAMQSIQDEINNTGDQAKSDQLKIQLATAKDKLRSLSVIVSTQNRGIANIQSKLDSLAPDLRTQAYAFANNVHLPKRVFSPTNPQEVMGTPTSFGEALDARTQVYPEIGKLRKQLVTAESSELKNEILGNIKSLQNKYKPGFTNSSTFMGKYGARDNPVFISEGSELADVMNSFSVSDIDINKDMNKTFSFKNLNPFNIENYRRELQREMGPNNVFEKFVNKIKDRDFAVEKDKEKLLSTIKNIGIKEGTTESAIMQQLGEGKISKTSPEFMKLDAKTQTKILNGISVTKNIYNDLIDSLNTVNRNNNLPEITKMDNYFLHFNETMEFWADDLLNFFKDPTSIVRKDNSGRMYLNQKFNHDPTKTVFRSERRRKGLDYTDDAIGGLKRYIKPALERTYYSDLIREVDVAKQFAPQNLGDFLQSIKDNVLIGKANWVDEKASKKATKALSFVSRRLGKGAILFNINTVAQQILSMPMNAAISPWSAVKALGQRFTKQGKEILKESRNIALVDPLFIDIGKAEGKGMANFVLQKMGVRNTKAAQAYLKTQNGVTKFWDAVGSWGMQTFDGEARKHAFLTGYNVLKSKGANAKQARVFADKWTEMIHGDMSKTGQAEIFQSKILRSSLLKFQSFLTNFSATLMNDLPTMVTTDGADKAITTTMRFIAGATIANETSKAVGVPEPFDIMSFMPFFGTSRFGVPGLAQVPFDIAGAISPDKRDNKQSRKDLKRLGIALSVPGGSQLYKTGTALMEDKGIESPVARASIETRKALKESSIFGHGKKLKEVLKDKSIPKEQRKKAFELIQEDKDLIMDTKATKHALTGAYKMEKKRKTPFPLIKKKPRRYLFGPKADKYMSNSGAKETKGLLDSARKKIRGKIYGK